jgi:hypothetical protein
VVGAVGFVGFGDWNCVVYCAVDDFWMELERLKMEGVRWPAGRNLAGLVTWKRRGRASC